MATKITTAQKNEMVKTQAIGGMTFPEGTIQYDDYSYAIPVTVDGEERYSKVEVKAGNNKDTKTTSAFDPQTLREEWLADKADKATKTEQAKLEKEKKIASKKSKSETTD